MKQHQNTDFTKEQNIEMKSSQTESFEIENTDHLLELMAIYLNEWTHRDEIFLKEILTYFFAIVVVMILPYIEIYKIEIGDYIPRWLFPLTGIFLSFLFLILGRGYAFRLQAIGNTYNDLIKKLPEEYRRTTLEELNPGDISNKSLAKIIVYTFFGLLILLAVFLICVDVIQ